MACGLPWKGWHDLPEDERNEMLAWWAARSGTKEPWFRKARR